MEALQVVALCSRARRHGDIKTTGQRPAAYTQTPSRGHRRRSTRRYAAPRRTAKRDSLSEGPGDSRPAFLTNAAPSAREHRLMMSSPLVDSCGGSGRWGCARARWRSPRRERFSETAPCAGKALQRMDSVENRHSLRHTLTRPDHRRHRELEAPSFAYVRRTEPRPFDSSLTDPLCPTPTRQSHRRYFSSEKATDTAFFLDGQKKRFNAIEISGSTKCEDGATQTIP